MSIHITTSTLRRVVFATVLAAAATVGGSTIGEPSVACAAPNEWDIGAYDACMKSDYPDIVRGKAKEQSCCAQSGGVWDTKAQKCVAPNADASQQPSFPNTAPDAGEATQNPAPPLPPIRNPEVTQTFTPAPASPG